MSTDETKGVLMGLFLFSYMTLITWLGYFLKSNGIDLPILTTTITITIYIFIFSKYKLTHNKK